MDARRRKPGGHALMSSKSIRRPFIARTNGLADKRQVRVIVSTEDLGRDGLVVLTSGINLHNFRLNPVILWAHNPDWPIARAVEINPVGNTLVSLAQFPPAGASERADEIFELIRAGVINAASIGFEIEEGPDKDGKVARCELAEYSFVAIPALPNALVTERARPRRGATMARGTMGYYREIAERFERQMLAERFERELRAEGQADARAATRRGGGSTRESRARMAKLYEMDAAFEARERAFEARTTGHGLRR